MKHYVCFYEPKRIIIAQRIIIKLQKLTIKKQNGFTKWNRNGKAILILEDVA
ncbi:hypothetical protein [Dyadobacter sediminis]|uniref:hypothetical protein n=1 Tax=Dyadobacter sediminis TaxID=1493691 RepID=UPI0016684584|nr:hypothetical protein [Dyadobacter sediminis]